MDIINILLNKEIGRGLSCWSKTPYVSPTIREMLSSISIKTSWSAHTANSFKDRQIGALSIGRTITRKLSRSNQKKEGLQPRNQGKYTYCDNIINHFNQSILYYPHFAHFCPCKVDKIFANFCLEI